jgi:pimeloyl-ACP methyl ester carboxylesterase
MLQPQDPEKVYLSRGEAKEVRKADRLRNFMVRGTTLLTLATVGLAGYWNDVEEHQQVEAAASSHINVISGPKNKANDHTAILFFNGFGTYDADVPAKYLGPVYQQEVDGEVWSESYSNAPVNYEEMGEQLIDLADEKSVDEVDIVGYSAGGNIGSHVGAYIEQHSNLKIRLFSPVSTPDGTEGLRAARVSEMAVAKFVAGIPGAKYSSAVRFLGEMYFRRDQYMKASNPWDWLINFKDTFFNVWRDLGDKKLPGTWLLIDQVFAISDNSMKENIAAMGNTDQTHLKPVIEYLGTAKPGYDYMVNNRWSSKNICGYAGKAGLDCYVYNVPGAIHTRPDLDTKEYAKTVKDAMPQIQAALARAASAYAIQNEKIVTRVSIH